MTVDEKLQQVQLLSDGQITDEDARAGVGSVFSLVDPGQDQPLPADRGRTSRGCTSRSCSPTTRSTATARSSRSRSGLRAASTRPWSPPTDTIAARETATVGIKQIYSPMVDVSHEPRWGRISEGAGEDPYLGSVFAAARVKAAQGADYSAPDKVVTSVKHFAAYGQPEGGREYNTTDMSEARLRNLYLPPFKAAIDAGSDTVMCSFNAINGVPGCADYALETRPAQARVGLRRLRRERLHGRRRAPRVPAQAAGRGPVRPRHRRRRPRRGAGRAQRGHRLGDGEHEHPRLRQAAAGRAARSRRRGSTTRCGGSCA